MISLGWSAGVVALVIFLFVVYALMATAKGADKVMEISYEDDHMYIPPLKGGLERIQDERKRQIEVEGYTYDKDKHYRNKELYNAGTCYLLADQYRKCNVSLPGPWPWDPKFWKPTPENRIRELEKAGALFQAEYELTGDRFCYILIKDTADAIDRLLNNID